MVSKGRAQFLTPLKKSAEPRQFIAFDIESKHDDTQKAGFTRPFLVGVYDGKNFIHFRNDKRIDETLPWHERACARGGCIDKFLRYVFGETEGGRHVNRFKNADIYAHNLGGFDGLFLPSWLVQQHREYSFKIMPVQSRIQMMEVWKHNPSRSRATLEQQRDGDKRDRKAFGTWKFLDSYRIMPGSLEEMAKSFGFQGKVQHDLDLEEDDPRWIEYLEGDCTILWKILDKFGTLVRQMGGEVGITAPSTAMKLLRKRYLKEDDLIHRNLHFAECPYAANEKNILSDEDLKEVQKEKLRKIEEGCPGCAHEFFRSAYFGGRTEVFWRDGWGWYYDFNSSYPYSMKNLMPAGEMETLGENEDFTRYTKTDSHIGFIRCTVEIPADCYLPPLPVQLDGKLKFPAGRFSGTWNWLELQVLRRIGGRILHVEKSVWIKGKRFLADFVDSLYEFRQKKRADYDKGKDKTAKIMLNATFGKFGMEHERQEILIVKPGEEEPWGTRFPGESMQQWEKRAGQNKDQTWKTAELQTPSASMEHDSPVRIKDTHVDAPYIIPQIAAHITASSRMILWYAAQEIIERGYKIFYSDTDSILSDCPDIPHSNELGGMKKEFDGEKLYVYCYAPKMYYLKKETNFPGEHQYYFEEAEKQYIRKCLFTCPGCKKDKEGNLVAGYHEAGEKGNMCKKKCPGCADFKIMMKGMPKNLRTPEILDRLVRDHETIEFTNQERLGAIAKKGFKDTPRMVKVKKSLKSEYDKRIVLADGNTTPVVIDSIRNLSDRFREVASQQSYVIPHWLDEVLPEKPIHPHTLQNSN